MGQADMLYSKCEPSLGSSHTKGHRLLNTINFLKNLPPNNCLHHRKIAFFCKKKYSYFVKMVSFKPAIIFHIKNF